MSDVQFGAFYQVYKNNKATRFALENFRRCFPHNPIVLISDGGNDFSDIAKEFDCGYHMMDNLFAKNSSYKIYEDEDHCAWNGLRIVEWWRRQKLVCEETKQDYIMIMEDDVYVTDSFDIQSPFHLRGIRYSNPFTPAMSEEITKNSGVDRGYGMCGGSMYNAKTFLSIYDDVVEDIKNNHDRLMEEDRYQWKGLGAYDLSITYHFNKRGYEYQAAPWLVEVREGNINNYPVVHQWKQLYEFDTHSIINGDL